MPPGSRKPRSRASILRTLYGKTIRWELGGGREGPSVYHHTFNPDGSIVYRGAALSGRGSRILPSRALFQRLSEQVFVVSYLNPPYTLTGFLDSSTHVVSGVVSSEKMWIRFKGTWEVVRR